MSWRMRLRHHRHRIGSTVPFLAGDRELLTDERAGLGGCQRAGASLQAIAIEVQQLLATPSAFSLVIGLDLLDARADLSILCQPRLCRSRSLGMSELRNCPDF